MEWKAVGNRQGVGFHLTGPQSIIQGHEIHKWREINNNQERQKEVSEKNRGGALKSECEGPNQKKTSAIISPHKNVLVPAEKVMCWVKAPETRAKLHSLSACTPAVCSN